MHGKINNGRNHYMDRFCNKVVLVTGGTSGIGGGNSFCT